MSGTKFSNTTPPAPIGRQLIQFQADGQGNISASIPTGGGGGGVSSVAMTGDGVIFNATVPGSPITTTGTLLPSLLTQSANQILAGPTTGPAASPTFRLLVAADVPNLPASIITTGQLALARGGTNADLSATGGASKVLKQVSVGAAITVGQLAASDLSNGVTGSGAVVLATSPTLVTPILGVASATSLTTPLVTTATAQLQLQETGDALGIINVYLRNRGGSNGAIFENPSVCLTDFGLQTSAIITNIAINGSNVLTVSAIFASVASSLPSVGQKLTLSGLTTATFLNGQTVTVATISATQFTATFTHALYASAPDTGIAVAQNNLRAEFRNDHVAVLNPNGEIQFLDPVSGTPWLASGSGSTALTGQLVVTNSSSGILPTITGIGISADANVTLGSGTGKAYGVIGVVRGGSDIVGDRAYGGWFKATAQSQTTTEVGIHAEVADVGGMPGEFYASGGLVAQIGSHGTIVGVAGSASFRNTLQLLSDAPRLYFGTGASFTNFKISDQDSVANALEISVGAGGQADPTADTYTAMVLVNSTGVRVGTSAPTGFTLGIGGDGSVKSLGISSQYESNDGTVRGVSGVTAFTTGGYQIGTTTSHPVRILVGATQIVQHDIAATLPAQTNQPLHIAGGFASPVSAKIYVGDGTGWELDFAKRVVSVDTTLFKMKDSGVLDIATGITIAGAAATGNVLRGNGTNFVAATLAAADLSDGVTGSGAIVLASAPTITSLAMSGKITTYNNIATVGNGVPSEVASVALTLQSAAKTTTTLYAVPASGAGQYRISWNAKVTRAATTSSTLGALTIVYTDPDGVVNTVTCAGQNLTPTTSIAESLTGNSTGTVLLGFPLTLNCKASTNITYAFGYVSSGATTMQYNLNLILEAH